MARNNSEVPTGVEPAKLICGFIYRHRDLYVSAINHMEEMFGPVEFESELFEFSHTDYYRMEMGDNLMRCFVSFENPVAPDRLSELKLSSIEIERKFLNDAGGRTINIDPGLVTLANLALASTKDFAHRLYLGKGIYGEVSLLYENRTFVPLKWSYPDYQRPEVINFLLRVREGLKDYIILMRQKTK